MKKFLFLISSFSLLATVAAAGTVTFSTSGAFNCNGIVGCTASGSSVTDNGVTLTYAPTSTSVSAPTFTNFGQITATGGQLGNSLNGVTFTLTINQTVPSVGTGTLTAATLTGGITAPGTSGAFITFQAPNFSVEITGNTFSGPGVQIAAPGGPVTYIVPNNPLAIVAPTSGAPAGVTSIQGAVSDSPEPVTFVLVGAGLGLVGLLRRRR